MGPVTKQSPLPTPKTSPSSYQSNREKMGHANKNETTGEQKNEGRIFLG